MTIRYKKSISCSKYYKYLLPIKLEGVDSMSKKDELVNEIKAQIDKWSIEIERLEKKIEKAKPDIKVEQEEQLSLLRNKYYDAKQKLLDVQNSSEEAWDDIKEGIEDSWKSIQSAFSKALSRFK